MSAKSIKNFSSLLVGLVVLGLVGLAAPVWASDACGTVVGPGGLFVLDEDLVCTGPDPPFTLEADSKLDLGGHTVDCDGSGINGVEINGSKSLLENGTITDCFIGVLVGGPGGHLVTKVNAVGSGNFGFRIIVGSNGNLLTYNTATNTTDTGSTGDGFRIESDDNALRHNTSKNNEGDGYDVISGNRNTVDNNVAKGNGDDGFDLAGNPTNENAADNAFTNNRAIGNGDFDEDQGEGFDLDGVRLSVIHNVAKGNADDGFDVDGDGSQLVNNKSVANKEDGYDLESGAGYLIIGNLALKNEDDGIELEDGAINSQIVGNTSFRNTNNDLIDKNDNCDNNTWAGNRFQTADPANCIN